MNPDGVTDLERLHEPDLEATEAQLQVLAEIVSKRRMAAPAIFFLELHKPLTTLLHSASVISAPVITPLFGAKMTRSVMKVLECRENVEKLIGYIEAHERARKT